MFKFTPILLILLISQTLKANHSWLILGDSHSAGMMGEALENKIHESLGDSVHRIAISGSSLISWNSNKKHYNGSVWTGPKSQEMKETYVINSKTVQTPTLEEVYQKINPNYLIMAFGENDLQFSQEKRKTYFQRTVQWLESKGNALKCFFIMPPYSRKNLDPEYLLDFEIELTSYFGKKCEMISSKSFTCEESELDQNNICPKNEKNIHFFGKKAKNWGLKLAEQILETKEKDSNEESKFQSLYL